MERKHNSLMFISFLAYYIILFAERVTSLVMSITDKDESGNVIGIKKMFFGTSFNKVVYAMTILALLVSLILFLRIVGRAMSYGISGSSTVLILNAGVLLVAGMQETAHTFVVFQFVAYIFLFIGCLTKFIDIMHKKDAKASTIASFVYFVAFGMAIPVIHHVTVDDAQGARYYYLFEFLASCGLCLTFMIIMFFLFSEERYRHINNVVFFILLIAADALVLVQGFAIGAPNFFMAGALAVAAISYLVTVILLFKDKKAKLL